MTAWHDEEPELVDRWTLADQDDENFTSVAEILWDDTGHHGELWLGPEDGDYVEHGGSRTRKPVPNDVPMLCGCDWPVPVNWSWSQCEFGGPRAWRSVQRWSTYEGRDLRTHVSIARLIEISPVSIPAYQGTTVALRSKPADDIRSQLIRARARVNLPKGM